MDRGFAIFVVLSLMAMCFPSSLAMAQEGQSTNCEILADWDQQWQWSDEGESEISLIHRYRVVFDPPFTNGTSPTDVNTSVQHFRGESEISGENTSTFVAGGEIDIILAENPQFGDLISISSHSTES
ncbi:MAG: hypothetical protein QF354_05105, partial [Candidatus Thalassarchaeum sp.]|nr:hypothetical protein [Candidatus Thalassarchaeum sp.]